MSVKAMFFGLGMASAGFADFFRGQDDTGVGHLTVGLMWFVFGLILRNREEAR